MSHRFRILVEVGEGVLSDINLVGEGGCAFTSREFGECLHEAMFYLPPWERYHKPLRRGAIAGQVLRALREKGLVVRCPPRSGKGWWQRVA